MFQLVASGDVTEDMVRTHLFAAAETNGLVAEDGAAQVYATIDSGARAGNVRPRTHGHVHQRTKQEDPPPALKGARASTFEMSAIQWLWPNRFVAWLTLLTAGFLLLARILKLGFLADFLSRTVLVGFLTGVGIQVGMAMLGDMLGIAVRSRHTLIQASEILQGLAQVSIPTLWLSALVAGSILLGNRVAPRLPVSLVAVVGAIAASAAFRFAERT
jgi:hypothetical protein